MHEHTDGRVSRDAHGALAAVHVRLHDHPRLRGQPARVSGRTFTRFLGVRVAELLPLPREFYARPVLNVAKACIGKILVHRSDEGLVAGRIVETEAYRGPEDRAAHSYGGRRTART